MRPSAEIPLAAGKKNPDNPVDPVKIYIIKIESISQSFHLFEVSHELGRWPKNGQFNQSRKLHFCNKLCSFLLCYLCII